jgi:hypothetical protein
MAYIRHFSKINYLQYHMILQVKMRGKNEKIYFSIYSCNIGFEWL